MGDNVFPRSDLGRKIVQADVSRSCSTGSPCANQYVGPKGELKTIVNFSRIMTPWKLVLFHFRLTSQPPVSILRSLLLGVPFKLIGKEG